MEVTVMPNLQSLAFTLSVIGLVIGFTITAFKWRFPCTNVESLEEECKAVQDIITGTWSQDLLGDLEAQFKQAWRSQREKVDTIQLEAIRKPDSRTHPMAYIHFYWYQLRAIDTSYTTLKELSASITLKIEMEKKRRQYFCPADAVSSGIGASSSGSLRVQPGRNSE
ncbi:hypothetical protein VNI00_019057 [Paramarasmius palmivorus]|uniref:Uncharacterized protein n=1 Tax=Paramarasmius palmivorus TaxID=297713 RepID=A0AAW0AS56_9AGAR